MNQEKTGQLIDVQRENQKMFFPLHFHSTRSISSGELILRLAVFGTYLGHGVFALAIKQSWIPLITAFGFSKETAITLLPLIGFHDIIIAFVVMIIPFRSVLIWATIWAFATALSRPVSGEPFAELIERTANWGAPLALLILQGFPKTMKDLIRIR